MIKVNKDIIINILKNIKDIETEDNIVSTGTLKNIIIEDNLVSIIFQIKHKEELYKEILLECKSLLNQYESNLNYNILLTTELNSKNISTKNTIICC